MGLNWTDCSRCVTISWHCAKTVFARQTAEATYRLKIGCWCQSNVHSHPISGLLNSRILCTSFVSQYSHSSHGQCPKRHLTHSHWIPVSHSNRPPTHKFRVYKQLFKNNCLNYNCSKNNHICSCLKIFSL